ncbi:MAG: Rieske 2Fe-2S domain-containing protein [Actinomycetota bacterium]|nr:Rieske 2Fe-2S domain-containing protein [Actinomycetota bacterium]
MRPFDDIDRISRAQVLDRVTGPVSSLIQKLLSSQRLRDVLHGVWLGHPLHPALVQLPIGSFVSASVLDLIPGQERAADTLVGLGIASSLPAATAGWADWTEGHVEQQRVGFVHAMANYAGIGVFGISLWLRLTGRRGAGVAAGYAAMTLLTAGATLGGHLSYRLAMGANHAHGVPHVAPSDWTDLGPIEDVPPRTPTKRMMGDVPVVVVRTGESVDVLAATCTHAGGPLQDGELVDGDGSLCIRCPWHGSVVRIDDGTIVHGPATAPQPVFDAHVVDGHLHAKVQTVPGDPVA